MVRMHTRYGYLMGKLTNMQRAHDRYVTTLYTKMESAARNHTYCRPCMRDTCQHIASSSETRAAHLRSVHAKTIMAEVHGETAKDPKLLAAQALEETKKAEYQAAKRETQALLTSLRDAAWHRKLEITPEIPTPETHLQQFPHNTTLTLNESQSHTRVRQRSPDCHRSVPSTSTRALPAP